MELGLRCKFVKDLKKIQKCTSKDQKKRKEKDLLR